MLLSFSFNGIDELFAEIPALDDDGSNGRDNEAEGNNSNDCVWHDESSGKSVSWDDCRSVDDSRNDTKRQRTRKRTVRV